MLVRLKLIEHLRENNFLVVELWNNGGDSCF